MADFQWSRLRPGSLILTRDFYGKVSRYGIVKSVEDRYWATVFWTDWKFNGAPDPVRKSGGIWLGKSSSESLELVIP